MSFCHVWHCRADAADFDMWQMVLNAALFVTAISDTAHHLAPFFVQTVHKVCFLWLLIIWQKSVFFSSSKLTWVDVGLLSGQQVLRCKPTVQFAGSLENVLRVEFNQLTLLGYYRLLYLWQPIKIGLYKKSKLIHLKVKRKQMCSIPYAKENTVYNCCHINGTRKHGVGWNSYSILVKYESI